MFVSLVFVNFWFYFSDSLSEIHVERQRKRLSDRVTDWPSDPVTQWPSDPVTQWPSGWLTCWHTDGQTAWTISLSINLLRELLSEGVMTDGRTDWRTDGLSNWRTEYTTKKIEFIGRFVELASV